MKMKRSGELKNPAEKATKITEKSVSGGNNPGDSYPKKKNIKGKKNKK